MGEASRYRKILSFSSIHYEGCGNVAVATIAPQSCWRTLPQKVVTIVVSILTLLRRKTDAPVKLFLPRCIATAFAATPALAQESATLKKIKDTGTLTLGHRESSIPFSYYNDQQQVIGYSQELMLKVVDAVKEDLKLAKLDTKLMPVTSANRITLVQNGTVDIECGSTTNNLERQKQVGFSTTIFIIGTRLMTKKDSGIKDFPDLAGKNVVTTAGTTSERLLRKMNEDKQMKMNIISAKDHGESFLTLETGRAVAFMMDDALLYGEMAKAKKPGDWIVTGTPSPRKPTAAWSARTTRNSRRWSMPH